MPFSIGIPVQVLVTPTTVSLQAPTPLEGTAPFTYQWYRSPVPFTDPGVGTLLTGEIESALIDIDLPSNAIFYYLVTVTDSALSPLTAISPAVGICTAYKSQKVYNNPSVADFQNFYNRDFPYGDDINKAIGPGDILKGFQQSNTQINVVLYLSQQSYTTGYLWLSAHRLCTNINNSSQGLNGQTNWGQVSKSAGGVSESFVIPEMILKNPTFYAFTKTSYGFDYIMDLLPRMVAPMQSVFGNTKP